MTMISFIVIKIIVLENYSPDPSGGATDITIDQAMQKKTDICCFNSWVSCGVQDSHRRQVQVQQEEKMRRV